MKYTGCHDIHTKDWFSLSKVFTFQEDSWCSFLLEVESTPGPEHGNLGYVHFVGITTFQISIRFHLQRRRVSQDAIEKLEVSTAEPPTSANFLFIFLHIDPEDGSDIVFRNIGPYANYTTLQPRRPHSYWN
jgi:hypothetical protein